MTTAPGERDGASLQRIIDKTQARRMVAAMLDGSGLTVKEGKRELVITNRRNPEAGRIYVEYASGYVSWERTAWQHWRPLQGYHDEDDTGKHVGADQIVTALCRIRFLTSFSLSSRHVKGLDAPTIHKNLMIASK